MDSNTFFAIFWLVILAAVATGIYLGIRAAMRISRRWLGDFLLRPKVRELAAAAPRVIFGGALLSWIGYMIFVAATTDILLREFERSPLTMVAAAAVPGLIALFYALLGLVWLVSKVPGLGLILAFCAIGWALSSLSVHSLLILLVLVVLFGGVPARNRE